MAIYRGAGGSGDAINDASSEALLTVQARNAAQAAQTAAELARDAAQLAETNAETAETNAETAETNAETAQAAAEAAQTAAEAAQAAAEAAQAAAETAETNAETAETNAETAETNAAASAALANDWATKTSGAVAGGEYSAKYHAQQASSSASAASTSASNAATSESNAASSASAAAASYDNFDDRYLGAKSSNPTVDNDGNALLTGALYYNTTAPEMRVYNGTSWTFIGSGAAAGVDSFNSRTGAVTLTSSDVTTALTYTPLAPSAIGTTVQAYDADLTTLGAGGSSARSFLGLAIGTDVQAWDADLDTWATKTAPSGTVVGTTDSQTLTNKTISGASNTLSNIANSSLTNSSITINGSAISLGGSVSVGTVTSVTGTSPVASSGGATPAISLSSGYGDTQNPYASKTANYVLASPNGSSGVPTFRALVAADVPTLNQNTTGTASNVTGTVAIANGGTGQTTANAAYNALSPMTTTGDMEYRTSGGVAARLPIGSSGQVLTVSSGIPAWGSSAGGATVTSSSTDVTLTSSSNRVQQVSMTAYGNKVILPDATTISTLGGSIFIIENNGYIAFDIAVSTGGRLFGLAGGQTVEISLANSSDATSGWIATPIGQMAITQSFTDAAGPVTYYTSSMFTSGTTLLSYTPADMNSTNSYAVTGTDTYSAMTCVALSTTSVMAVWIAPTTGYPTACVGTISGTSISWGTPAIVNNARAYSIVKMCALSSTTGLIVMQSGASYYAIGFSVSGTTLTFSTLAAASTATIFNIVPVTATTALATYSTGSRVITYNGASAPTYGTGQAVSWAVTTNGMGLVPLTATTYLAAWQNTDGTFKAVVLTVSGTTVTDGVIASVTPINVGQNYYANGNLIGISSTEAVYVIQNQWIRWTVSGTTVTAGTKNFLEPLSDTYPNKTWNNFIMSGVTSQLIGSTDFIALTPSQGIVRGSYNSASLSAKGYSLCANSCLPFAVCTVSTTRGLVVGLSTRSDGTNNYYPTGYLVDLNG